MMKALTKTAAMALITSVPTTMAMAVRAISTLQAPATMEATTGVPIRTTTVMAEITMVRAQTTMVVEATTGMPDRTMVMVVAAIATVQIPTTMEAEATTGAPVRTTMAEAAATTTVVNPTMVKETRLTGLQRKNQTLAQRPFRVITPKMILPLSFMATTVRIPFIETTAF